LAGTCLAVRRSAFQEAGGFDESYFLYNEDMALGDRLRRRGLRQVLRADLSVRHEGGGSSAGPSNALWLLRAASLSRYIGRHNRPVAAFCMRAVLATGSLARAALMSVLPGRRGRRREMVTYVRGTLRPQRATDVAVMSLLGRVSQPSGGEKRRAPSLPAPARGAADRRRRRGSTDTTSVADPSAWPDDARTPPASTDD
jgi:hypothetical protein